MKNSPGKKPCCSAVICHLAVALACPFALCLIAAAGAPPQDPPAGWWRDATFYEIFVRSFADASSGPLANDGVGDLQGLIEHLDYLNDGNPASEKSLGITAVWLMPVQPSPSYHGYDVTDYFDVNPQYGDLALFKRFVAEAHRRGIRVIIDLVLNHGSSQHPLFRAALAAPPDSPVRNLFRFAEIPDSFAGPWGDRAWHHVDDGFYYGIFSAEMPDWNFRDAAVTDHHRRTAAFWLRDVGVDGFRLDAARYFFESGEDLQDTTETKAWLRDFTEYCWAVKPGAFVIGEITAGTKELATYLRGGSLDSAFEFDLAQATIESVRYRVPGILMRQMGRLRRLHAGASPWATFLSNHDQARTRSQLGGSPEKARLAAKLLFALPGVPFIYYGEEIGMTGVKPDPDLRTPMPWTGDVPNAGFTAANARPWRPLAADFPAINVAGESLDRDSLLALYRRLIRMNRASPALRHGAPLDVDVARRDVYATMRESDGEIVLVLANLGATTQRDVALTLARSSLRRDWTMKEILAGAAVAPPGLDDAGGFKSWMPLAELAPESVYVVRWKAPAGAQ